jgi:RNA polymerase sigma-70 factor, ECF subfamily
MTTPDAPGDLAISIPTDSGSVRARLTTPDTVLDDILVRRHGEGDEGAFLEIITRFRPRIFAVTLHYLRSRLDAEEVTQDTFIRAYRGLASFRGDSSLSTWLYRIAINLARNRYWFLFRRHRQDTISLDGLLKVDGAVTLADIVADRSQGPAQEELAREFTVLMDRCIEKLRPRQREILLLRIVSNHSYDEIAAILAISCGTVKSRIARAREELRALLSADCPEFVAGTALGEWFEASRSPHGCLAAAAV